MSSIKKIMAREILDSRGYPTIEGKLELDDDRAVVTSVPSGTSVSKYEAVELRDSDLPRLDGMGVTRAVSYINDLIGPKLAGASPLKQKEIDSWLIKSDGTPLKSKIGGNTTLTVSQLVAKASAVIQGVPLYQYLNDLYKTVFKTHRRIERIPTPIFNIINGGAHAANNLEFQEFQVIPSSSFNFKKSLDTATEIFHELKRVLLYRNANVSVGHEGGYTPNFPSNLDALEAIMEAIIKRKYKAGLDVFLGLDIAASHFFKHDRYILKDKPHSLKKDEYITYLTEMTKNYPFLTFEDPVDQDDIDGWRKLCSSLSKEIYLIGDDLIATNKERLKFAIDQKMCTSVLIKPNQVGTIIETMEVIDVARQNNLTCVVSHRSGETTDSFIADFAVGMQSEFVKFGAPSRGERVVKYNRLLEIESSIISTDDSQSKGKAG